MYSSDALRRGSSAKIDQLVSLLLHTPKSQKSLVFSQFTAFLDKIEDALDEAGIAYSRLDGRMTVRQRQETLDTFSQPVYEQNEGTPIASSSRSRSVLRTKSKGDVYVADDGDEDDDDNNDGEGDGDVSMAEASYEEDDHSTSNVSLNARGKRKAAARGEERTNLRQESARSHTPAPAGSPRVLLISLKVCGAAPTRSRSC